MQAKRVWVFDLDDTLYSEYEYMASGYQHVCDVLRRNYGAQLKKEQLLGWWHEDRGSVFQKVVDAAKLPVSAIDSLIWLYRTHLPQICLYHDAENLLKKIQGKEPYYIVTDGRSLSQRLKIKALGLQPKKIFISEEVGESKPYTPAFDEINSLQAGAEFVYFADNPSKDFIKPNQLGWQTFGMLDRGFNIHEQLIKAPGDNFPGEWLNFFDEFSEV